MPTMSYVNLRVSTYGKSSHAPQHSFSVSDALTYPRRGTVTCFDCWSYLPELINSSTGGL